MNDLFPIKAIDPEADAAYWREAYDDLNAKVSFSSEANDAVKAMTNSGGDLECRNEPEFVHYFAGHTTVSLAGHFDADTLLAIAMHMRSQQ